MIFRVAAYIVLFSFIQPHDDLLIKRSSAPTVQLKEKKFKVSSLPFYMNGMHLQYQYTVQEDPDVENPKKQVLLLDKRLIDLKSKTTVCVLEIPMVDEHYPSINLSDIDNVKFNSRDFDDVNFDGYKDIREECEPCSGATNLYENIYLFNPHTKKFKHWNALAGVMLNAEDKTVSSADKSGATISYQEFKFDGRGFELYRKDVNSALFNDKKQSYKITYSKYVGKKLIAHKTKIILIDKVDVWAAIDEIIKEHHATSKHSK